MRNLQLRIVLAIVLVCAATVAAVASYVGRTTVLVRVGEPPETVISPMLAAASSLVASNASPAVMEPKLARIAAARGVRVVLVEPSAGIAIPSWAPTSRTDVAVHDDGAVSLTFAQNGSTRKTMIELHGGTHVPSARNPGRWTMFVLPNEEDSAVLATARGSILRSIWESSLLGLAIAVAVATLLGSYIVRPIRALTAATQAMTDGDTSKRVAVAGSDEIARLASSFNIMADAIETTEDLRRQMVTEVAHELRTPLTRMILQLEAATDGHLSRAEALSGTYDEAKRLEAIVNDLRDLSLADSHEIAIASEIISLAACIRDAVQRVAAKAAQSRVSISEDVQAGLPAVLADPMRVAQILDNLLANALHYTPQGGSIRVGARAASSNVVECFVSDNGIGIAPEHVPYIFERFYRVDPSRSRTTGGSGLGLAIAKSLTEAQGGTIRVESTPGNGSQFTWTLRRAGE